MLEIVGLGIAGWLLFIKRFGMRLGNNRGGGEKPSVTTIQQPAAPSASESASDIYKARLQYDPLIAQQEMDIQKQMLPQQSALYQSLYNQYYPQMAQQQQALQKQLYPQQSQILEAGAGQALQRIQNPNYMTPEEEVAQAQYRQKSVTDLQKAMRERANLGGGLYGGRAAGAEAQTMSDLQNQFQMQDYQNRMTAGQNAQEALRPYMSILYPQIGTTQPNYSQYQYTSAVPQANQLYEAMYGASRPEYFYNQGSPSPAWGLAGSILGGAATGFGAGMGQSKGAK